MGIVGDIACGYEGVHDAEGYGSDMGNAPAEADADALL